MANEKVFFYAKKMNREVKIEESAVDKWVKDGYIVYKSNEKSAYKSPVSDKTAKLEAENKELKAEIAKLEAENKELKAKADKAEAKADKKDKKDTK